MLNLSSNWQIAICALLLLAGVVDDLRSKKVHNPLVITAFVIAIVSVLVISGTQGLMMAGISLLTAIVAILPLYFLKIIGGGDVKLFIAVSPLLTANGVLVTLFGAIIWGALLGLIMVFTKKQGKVFANNLLSVVNKVKPSEGQLTKVPFTVAFFFGFLSHVFASGVL